MSHGESRRAGEPEAAVDPGMVLLTGPDAVAWAFDAGAGGNSLECAVAFQEWSGGLAPEDAADTLTAVAAAYTRDRPGPGELDPASEDQDGGPFGYQHGWGFRLIALRYGWPAAAYWRAAYPGLLSMGIPRLTSLRADGPAPKTSLRGLLLELSARLADRQERFSDARGYLDALSTVDPRHAGRLSEEYKNLKGARLTDLEDTGSAVVQLQRLHVRVKELVAPLPLHATLQPTPEQVDDDAPIIVDVVAAAQLTQRTTPVAAGQTLEEAALALLRRLFDVSREQNLGTAPLLRRQRGGYQFGHDLSFDATVTGTGHVHCHVECKNYRDPVSAADIVVKLAQQKLATSAAPIDHWILISPHSDPANDFQEMLRAWQKNEEYGFSVQVWSPQSGIRELFATAPAVYQALYGGDPPDVDSLQVTKDFLARIAPLPRIPRPFRSYLREPWRMCFPAEDAEHFGGLVFDHVEIGAVDAAGRPFKQSLITTVQAWLDKPGPEAMLLLGEFGDGKSFFTFLLCQQLAQTFLADPGRGIYPVRLSLRELRQAGSPAALVTGWLEGIGATRAEWAELAATHPVLIILDGFDEMTAALDPPTVSANLELLAVAIDTLAGPATSANRRRKFIVTSRGRFFDQPREEAALRERLHDPRVARISALSRVDVLASLARYASHIGEEEKLARIQALYDPIGLAAKPLFLQMIKETLHDLPDDKFDAATLYETYITRSLERKREMLVSSRPLELAGDVIDRLRGILEQVAITLHATGPTAPT